MANFKITVRRKRNDGFYPVYIRISKGTAVRYIRTEKLTTDEQLSKSGEVTDPFVLESLGRRINHYAKLLNHYETERMDIGQIYEILTKSEEDLSFTEYAVRHIDRMIDNGQERTAQNYKQALGHLQRYCQYWWT